jgi:uncharacterized membrane protein
VEGDENVYKWAGVSLQVGMYASLSAMVLGLVWWLAVGAPGGETAATQVIALDEIPGELAALNPLALLNTGIALLLATPGVTLLIQIAAYLAARNYRWAGIASLVAFILLLSLAISLNWIKVL